MRRSHTLTTAIARPFDEVYDYLAQPVNYQYWAAVEGGTFRPLPNGDWEGVTPAGPRHFRFTPPNNFGVLDHTIFVPGGELLTTPMRAVPNEAGTELIFTFFQRSDMDDDQFASTLEWIQTDFLALKSLLEARNRS